MRVSKIRFKILTVVNDTTVIQTITYLNRLWWDRQLTLYQVRRQVQLHIRLNLKIQSVNDEKKEYVICYHISESDINIKKFDGNFYVNYVKRRKICHNCTAWRKNRRYCDWKDQTLIREMIRCDGFLENLIKPHAREHLSVQNRVCKKV